MIRTSMIDTMAYANYRIAGEMAVFRQLSRISRPLAYTGRCKWCLYVHDAQNSFPSFTTFGTDCSSSSADPVHSDPGRTVSGIRIVLLRLLPLSQTSLALLLSTSLQNVFIGWELKVGQAKKYFWLKIRGSKSSLFAGGE